MGVRSDCVEWLMSKETFVAEGIVYDIDKAKEILKTKPREAIMFSVNEAYGYLGWVKTRQKYVNLDVPLILADNHMPIDGWHRLMAATVQGIQFLPAFLLTEQETLSISEVLYGGFTKLPP